MFTSIFNMCYYNQALLKEFQEMQKMPIFLIEDKNGKLEEWEVIADKVGISIKYREEYHLDWDSFLGLDSHLQELYDRILEDME